MAEVDTPVDHPPSLESSAAMDLCASLELEPREENYVLVDTAEALPPNCDRDKYVRRMTRLFKAELERQVQHHKAARVEADEAVHRLEARNAALLERLKRTKEKQDHDRVLHFKQILTLKDQLSRINHSAPCMKELSAVATNMREILNSGRHELKNFRWSPPPMRVSEEKNLRLLKPQSRSEDPSSPQSSRRRCRRRTDIGAGLRAQLELDIQRLKSENLEGRVQEAQQKNVRLEREIARLRCFEADAAAHRKARRELLEDDDLAVAEIGEIVDSHADGRSVKLKVYEMVKPEQSLSSEEEAKLRNAAAERDDAMKLLEDSYEDQAKLMRQLEDTKLQLQGVEEERNELSERCESLSAQLKRTMAQAVANRQQAEELQEVLHTKEEHAEEELHLVELNVHSQVYSEASTQTNLLPVDVSSCATQTDQKSIAKEAYEQACMSNEDLRAQASNLELTLKNVTSENALRASEVEDMFLKMKALEQEKAALERSNQLLSMQKADIEKRVEMLEQDLHLFKNRQSHSNNRNNIKRFRRASACNIRVTEEQHPKLHHGADGVSIPLQPIPPPGTSMQLLSHPESTETKRLRNQIDVLRKELIAALAMVQDAPQTRRAMRLLGDISALNNSAEPFTTPSILGKVVDLAAYVNESESVERQSAIPFMWRVTSDLLQACAGSTATSTATDPCSRSITCGSFPAMKKPCNRIAKTTEGALSKLYVTLATRQQCKHALVCAEWKRFCAKASLLGISARQQFVRGELEAHSRSTWIQVFSSCLAGAKGAYASAAEEARTCHWYLRQVNMLAEKIVCAVAVQSERCEPCKPQTALTAYINPLDFAETFAATMKQPECDSTELHSYAIVPAKRYSPQAPPARQRAAHSTPRLRYLFSTGENAGSAITNEVLSAHTITPSNHLGTRVANAIRH